MAPPLQGAALKVFHKAAVAKYFPGYGAEPFSGYVSQVDTRAKDGQPFKVNYDDGDAEWVSYQELMSILVDETLKAKGSGLIPLDADDEARSSGGKRKGASAAAAAAAGDTGSKRRRGGGQAPAAAADPQQQRGYGDEADDTDADDDDQAAAAEAAGARRQAKAAAAGGGRKRQRSRSAGSDEEAAAAAAAAGVAAAGIEGLAESEDGYDGYGADDDEFAGELQAGTPNTDILRLRFSGHGAATLPPMSKAVAAGGKVYITLYGQPQPAAARGAADAYQAETRAVLQQLDDLMVQVNAAKETLLTLDVHLRDVKAGLPGFTAAWKAWVGDNGPVPVLTVTQGASVFDRAGVVLQAQALTG